MQPKPFGRRRRCGALAGAIRSNLRSTRSRPWLRGGASRTAQPGPVQQQARCRCAMRRKHRAGATGQCGPDALGGAAPPRTTLGRPDWGCRCLAASSRDCIPPCRGVPVCGGVPGLGPTRPQVIGIPWMNMPIWEWDTLFLIMEEDFRFRPPAAATAPGRTGGGGVGGAAAAPAGEPIATAGAAAAAAARAAPEPMPHGSVAAACGGCRRHPAEKGRPENGRRFSPALCRGRHSASGIRPLFSRAARCSAQCRPAARAPGPRGPPPGGRPPGTPGCQGHPAVQRPRGGPAGRSQQPAARGGRCGSIPARRVATLQTRPAGWTPPHSGRSLAAVHTEQRVASALAAAEALLALREPRATTARSAGRSPEAFRHIDRVVPRLP